MELTIKEQETIKQVEYEYKQSVKKRKSEFMLFNNKGKSTNDNTCIT